MTKDINMTEADRQIEPVRVMPARANWGRWIVECFTHWCTNAWMPDLGQTAWRCEVCGLVSEIRWPADPIAIEALLLMRPDPNTRNWEPGESLEDLVMQNAEHDIFPPGTPPREEWDKPEASVSLMDFEDGRVIGGLVYGPIEAWRLDRGTDPSITAAGEPPAYLALPKGR